MALDNINCNGIWNLSFLRFNWNKQYSFMKGFVEKVYLDNGWQGIIIFAEILNIQNVYENLS